MTIAEAAKIICPEGSWLCHGDTYEGLKQAEPVNPDIEIPTRQAINALLNGLEHQAKRRREYPPLEDQLDAIWKGGQAAEDMRAIVMAVKAKYPVNQ